MRSESVPANEKPTTMTQEEEKRCAHQGHVVYQEQKENLG
jgi:hypothetical protein